MKKVLSILLIVCLILTTFASTLFISAENQADEYFYHFNDYESLAGDEAWLLTIKKGTAMSVESGTNVIDGNKSLKITSEGVGWVGAALSDARVPADVNARVTFDYKVTSGTKGGGGVGYIGSNKGYTNTSPTEKVNCYNWAHINQKIYTEAYAKLPEGKAVSTVKSFVGTIARKGTNTYPVGLYWPDGSAPSEVVFDNLKIAEIINTVSAVSADASKGTVSVTNKEGYTDYAMKETAIFTATPAEGCTFEGWYNGDTKVSDKSTYEHILSGDVTLTAKWVAGALEKEYQYLKLDYENGFFGESFPYKNISTSTSVVSEETTAPISGASSYKYQFVATGTKWAFLTPKTAEYKLKQGVSYRVSGHYKAKQTTSGVISMSIGAADGNSKLHGKDYATAKHTIINGIAATKDFIGTITTVDAGYPSIYGYSNAADAANDYILLDDIVYAEIIDTVLAKSADETMGTATVVNSESKFSNFAYGETAIFTATPAEGCTFEGWYNGDTKVSDKSTYEHILSGDVTLTAKWVAGALEKEYQYLKLDYENGFFGDSFPYTGISTGTSVVSEETTDPISGASSYKYQFGATGTKWAFLTPKTAEYKLKQGVSYRVSGHYKAKQTTSGVISMSIGAADGNSKLHGKDYATAKHTIINGIAATKDFIGTITTVDAGYPSIYGYSNAADAANDYILLDDIVYAEIIDTVLAKSADETMGTATVVNSEGTFTNFACGERVVFKAEALSGYRFTHWENSKGESVSTNANYTTALNTDITLTAHFEESNEDPTPKALITDGGFDNVAVNTNVSPFRAVSTARLNASSDEWFSKMQASNGIPGSFVKEDNGNKYAILNRSLYQVIDVKSNQTYKISFKVKADGENADPSVANSIFVRLLQSTNVDATLNAIGAITGGTDNGYHVFAPNELSTTQWKEYSCFLKTGVLNSDTVYVLNIADEAPSNRIAVDDILVVESVDDSGDNLQPFYGHGDVPKDDIVITFDDYPVTADRPDLIVVDAAPKRDGVPTNALHILPSDGTRTAILNWGTTTTNKDRWFTVPVKENTLYKWSMWVYIPPISSTDKGAIEYMNYWIDYVNNVSLSLKFMTERNKWVKVERTFTTKPGQTKLSMTFNAGEKVKEMWLDDFRITEVAPGSMVETNLSYCEEAYNIFADHKDYKDILKGKSGVYEIAAEKSAQFTFGITTVGGNANSKVYLSFDGSTVMPQSDPRAPLALAKANTKRLGFEMVTSTNGIVYLVIENPDNSMSIKNIQLFKTKSIGTARDMGYESDPNLPDPVLTVEKLTPIGKEDINGEAFEGSPATGDVNTALPAVIIAVTALLLALLVGYRRKEEC